MEVRVIDNVGRGLGMSTRAEVDRSESERYLAPVVQTMGGGQNPVTRNNRATADGIATANWDKKTDLMGKLIGSGSVAVVDSAAHSIVIKPVLCRERLLVRDSIRKELFAKECFYFVLLKCNTITYACSQAAANNSEQNHKQLHGWKKYLTQMYNFSLFIQRMSIDLSQ